MTQHLWDSNPPYVGDERAADVHVANIRRKLRAAGAADDPVVTVRAGYRLLAV